MHVTDLVLVGSIRLSESFVLSSVHNVNDFCVVLFDIDWVFNFYDLLNDLFSFFFYLNFFIFWDLYFNDLLYHLWDFLSDNLVNIHWYFDNFFYFNNSIDFSSDWDFYDHFSFDNLRDLLVNGHNFNNFFIYENSHWFVNETVNVFLDWFFNILGDLSVH